MVITSDKISNVLGQDLFTYLFESNPSQPDRPVQASEQIIRYRFIETDIFSSFSSMHTTKVNPSHGTRLVL